MGRMVRSELFDREHDMIQIVVALVGALLGGSISQDLSHHPSFPVASMVFPVFWAAVGSISGWVVGGKVHEWLERHYLL